MFGASEFKNKNGMGEALTIEAHRVEIKYVADLCIVGAGVAGLSAAIAAARSGLRVVILEKYGFSGGAAIAGLSGTICGLYSSGERPTQIVYGFADEFYCQLKLKNGVSGPMEFGRTKLIPYDSSRWKETADDYLLQHKVKVLYHSCFLKTILLEDGRIDAIMVKSTQGIFAIRAKVFIDASGDAELVEDVYADTFLGKSGVVQTPTMIFKMANVDVDKLLSLGPEAIPNKIKEFAGSDAYNLPRNHVYIFPLPNSGEVLCNMTKITYPDGSVPLGILTDDLSYAEIEGRRQCREYSRFLIDQIPAFSKSYLSDTATQVGIRQTRSIQGMEMLTNQDVMEARKRSDGITFSAWPIELHTERGVEISYLQNDYYDIPFGALVPLKALNLLAAGRCLYAEHEALASARVTAQCFGMGYAVGAASALMIKEELNARDISGEMVLGWMKQFKLKNAYER